MTSSLTRSHLIAIALFAAMLTGCGEKNSGEDTGNAVAPELKPDPVAITDARGFFNPKKDEAWVYRVTREVPVTARLSDHDALRVVAKHEHYYEMILERKRVCGGPVSVANSESELVLIDIFEDGDLAEQEYYEINDDGLFGRGWSGHPGEAPIISSTAIPIAVPGMEGGMMWRTSTKGSPRQFKFRVIDRSTLELPAGTFDVAQVQLTSGDALNSLKRTLWFADNVGIVKEVTTHYDATSIRLRETSELVSWQLPNGAQAKQSAEDPFQIEPATTGEPSDEENADEL